MFSRLIKNGGAAMVTCLIPLGTAVAGVVEIEGGDIAYRPPEGFVVLADEVTRLKFPIGDFEGTHVLGTEDGSVSVIAGVRPHSIPEGGLDEYRDKLSRGLLSVSGGMKVLKNETIEINGRKWGLLEIISKALDTDIHNIMVFTPYKGKVLIFNFNSTAEQYPRYGALMRASSRSIIVNSP